MLPVAVDHDQLLPEDGLATRPLPDPAEAHPLQHLPGNPVGGDEDHAVGVVAVDQPQPDGLVGEQLRGPFDDRLEHVVDGQPGDDRALDPREPLEQQLSFAKRLEEHLVLRSAAFAFETQLPFGAHRADRPQRQRQDAGDPAQQVRLLAGERFAAPGEDQVVEALVLDRDRDRVTVSDPADAQRSRITRGDLA